MRKLSLILLRGLLSVALSAAPVMSVALAADGDDPSRPKSDGSTKKPKKKSSVTDPKVVNAYRTAYATIYDRRDYANAIEQLESLGRNDVAD